MSGLRCDAAYRRVVRPPDPSANDDRYAGARQLWTVSLALALARDVAAFICPTTRCARSQAAAPDFRLPPTEESRMLFGRSKGSTSRPFAGFLGRAHGPENRWCGRALSEQATAV